MAGAAVTVATTAADYYWINPLEKSLQDKNSNTINDIRLGNKGTGKKIISQSN